MEGKLGLGVVGLGEGISLIRASGARVLVGQSSRYFPFGGAAHHVGEFANYLEAMGEALLTGAEPRPNLEDGLQVVATLLSIRQSIDTGAVIRVPDVLQRAGVSLG